MTTSRADRAEGRGLPMSWACLVAEVNGRTFVGQPGVRDPEYPCEEFDGRGYDGSGQCDSDGHYMCVECSNLASDAPRFQEYGRDGRADRLRLFWRRRRAPAASSADDVEGG